MEVTPPPPPRRATSRRAARGTARRASRRTTRRATACTARSATGRSTGRATTRPATRPATRPGCSRRTYGAGTRGRGNREERIGRVRNRERTMLTDRVGLDIEVEVDADLLEEVIADRDEANFDRHLEVLEPPQLPEQVGDLFVDFRRVLDDQAQAQEEGHDRTGLPLRCAAGIGTSTEAASQTIGRRDVLAAAVLNPPGPGAIDVEINWIKGVMSTSGRSPAMEPVPCGD